MDASEKTVTGKKYPRIKKLSRYIGGFDGTRLAADIVMPADENGDTPKEKLPVILTASRGGRWQDDCVTEKKLIACGYVYVIVEMRGCGASYGVNDSFASIENRKDVAAIIGWISDQPWCDGNIGMLGGSNRGFIQLASATLAPRGLRSIIPAVANIDFYYQNYPNGVSALPSRMLSGFSSPVKRTKEELLETVSPVDEDAGGYMAYEAYEKDQFPNNRNFVGNLLLPNMYRDSENPNFGGAKTNLLIPPVAYTDAFKKSDIKMYQIGGWFDSNVLGQLIAQKSWGGLLTIGPWNHFECSRSRAPENVGFTNSNLDLAGEYRRWFDRTLKNEENGMEQRPPLLYYTLGAKPGQEWRYAESWPPYNTVKTKLYFDGAKSGTVSSVNDGTLSQTMPEKPSRDRCIADTSVKVFDNGDGKGGFDRMNRHWDGDMSVCVDSKGLTYTSAPLFQVYENEMTGTPLVDLWVSSTAPDADFLVYLEEVFPDGRSKFITEGEIRASHRSVEANEAWEAVGAVYHPSLEDDCIRRLKEGMNEPVNLCFALEPTSYVFSKGSRIRVTVTFADFQTFQHPMYTGGEPSVELCLGGDRASSITLPFVEHTENVYNGSVSIGSYEGPATLYMFRDKMFLNFGGVWKSWDMESTDAEYELAGRSAVFKNAGFAFTPEGDPLKNGAAQNYQGGSKTTQPFPAARHMHLAAVPTQIRSETLFVPAEKNLLIDLFKPESGQDKAPCVIFIHGYGGSLSILDPQLVKLIDNGFAVAGVDLRNYPPNYSPDHIHDIKGSVRYLRANADRIGIDPDRIGVYGYSLGGNMALMLAVSGDDEEFEGTVGGNLGYSSRVQAAVAGYAWSDALYMGLDLANEYSYDPSVAAEKLIVSDGEFSPSCEIFGFSGKGKGIGVLRAYIEAGLEGTNELYDRKIAEAKKCSPLYHIKPDAPPIALFHGLGMTRVHIPNNQTYRTFEALSRNGVRAFMFSNTQGEYGSAPEIQDAVLSFLKNHLMHPPKNMKAVVKEGSKKAVVNNLSREMEAEAFTSGGRMMLPVSFVAEILGDVVQWGAGSNSVIVKNKGDSFACEPKLSAEEKGDVLRSGDGTLFCDVCRMGRLAGAEIRSFDNFKMVTITMQ